MPVMKDPPVILLSIITTPRTLHLEELDPRNEWN